MVKEVKSQGISGRKVMTKEEILVENFIGLQRAMVNLSIKFENLSDNISRLLKIFELSVKDYVDTRGQGQADRETVAKVSYLLEQNKSLAKDLSSLKTKQSQMEMNQNYSYPPLPTQQAQFGQSQQLPQQTQPNSAIGSMQPSSYAQPTQQKQR
jgi:hypothetical protein